MIAHPFRPAADLSGFWVIEVVSNPQRYQRRYELHFPFAEMLEAAGVQSVLVELQLGLRPFMLTEPTNPRHVQLRTVDELWHKENMINLGIQAAVEQGAREVAWIDADLRPTMAPKQWFEETWHALQHYEFVQMFDSLMDLALDGSFMPGYRPSPSFMANYVKMGAPDIAMVAEMDASVRKSDPTDYYGGLTVLRGHPGGAWAANVDALSKVGGLIDFNILGAGDHYMAYALVGMLDVLVAGGVEAESISSPAHTKKLHVWQDRAEHWIKRDVGFVPGSVLHDFHGPKKLRGYGDRWKILTRGEFDPDVDVKYDAQGLLQLETVTPRQIRMRDEVRAYFRSRNEDATS